MLRPAGMNGASALRSPAAASAALRVGVFRSVLSGSPTHVRELKFRSAFLGSPTRGFACCCAESHVAQTVVYRVRHACCSQRGC